MPYKIFEKKAARGASPPTISLSAASGRLGLNKAAADLLIQATADHVLLLWDDETNMIAIRPVKKRDERSFRITFGTGKSSAAISAKSFLSFVGHNDDATKRYPAKWNDAEGALEADLNKAIEELEQRVAAPNRTRRGA